MTAPAIHMLHAVARAGVGRAAVVAAPRTVRLETIDPPEPAANEVRIRLSGSGVCASNLPVWEGREWFEYPFAAGAPGHEGWGVIDAVGSAVRDLAIGTPVAALSQRAYADFDIAPASAVVPLPASLAARPVPGEPLGCAMNIAARSALSPGINVAIVGIGFLGALLVQLATHAGARVIALSRRPFSLDVARSCGADVTIPLEPAASAIERVRALTGGLGCRCVIEAVGNQGALDVAAELTAERGRLVIAGYHQDGPRTVNMQLWNWRGLDVINAHERDPEMYVRGMERAVEALRAGHLRPDELYTHRYPLDRLSDAFAAMRDRPDGFLKALVVT